jgi:seryl-tRNA synthetase
MIALERLREDPAAYKAAVQLKGITDVDIDAVLAADAQLRTMRVDLEGKKAEQNTLARQGKDRTPESIERAKQLKAEMGPLAASMREAEEKFNDMLSRVPNVLAPDVPPGTSDDDNREEWRWSEPRTFDFQPLDHITLTENLGLVEFNSPREFSGTRAYALTGAGALLELGILRMAFDQLLADGYVPVRPPSMVRDLALYGTGFFPGSRDDTYELPRDDKWLAGTSEVGLVNLHRDSVLEIDQLPIRYAGWNTCYRREAGSAGRDTRGLFRVFEFMKVEQVVIGPTDPDFSISEHTRLLANSERVLQLLELPYRVAMACSSETGFGQYRKHEVETWFPGRGDGGKYSETHSCSTLLDFQARRSNIRYRGSDGKLRFAHTLNNTAVASPRILAALLENHQLADGSVRVPKALRPYVNGIEVIDRDLLRQGAPPVHTDLPQVHPLAPQRLGAGAAK